MTALHPRGLTPIAVALALGVLAALAAAPGIAAAHARYARSTPGNGAVLTAAPSRVDMWTDSEMFRRDGANTLTVTGPSGAVVNQGATHLDDADRTHLWVELQPGLRPGRYTVSWHTLSADDQEEATGTFAFTVDPNATPYAGATATGTPAAAAVAGTGTPAASTPPPASSAAGGGLAIERWQVIVVASLLLAAAIAAAVILLGSPGDATTGRGSGTGSPPGQALR